MKHPLCKLSAYVAIALVTAMLIGVVGMIPQTSPETNGAEDAVLQNNDQAVQSQTAPTENSAAGDLSDISVEDLTQSEKEQIVTLLGDQQTVDDLENLSDEQIDTLVEQMLSDLETQDVSVETDSDNYNENGEMTVPFDLAYPELIEDGSVSYDDETLLIKLESADITEGMKLAGVAALELVVPLENVGWYEAKLVEGTDAGQALAALRQLPEVLLAEYNYEISTAAIDSYTEFDKDHDFGDNDHHDEQWYMHHCGIPAGMSAMEHDGGSSSVIVAVIDTGVDYDHEDLAQNIWVNSGEIPDNGCDDDGNGYVDDYYGVNIVYGSGNGDDDNGHGTHVAGIIAAQNNNLGVVGIAYNVKIMPVKAAMASGVLNQSDIAKAVLYAYEMGAEVINMSFGGTACSIAVQDALATAYTRCVLVASAGNCGMYNEGLLSMPNYPAALTYVLGVMSVDQNGRESSFTNWDVLAFSGIEYELYAPGNNIMSTLPNDKYGSLSGTSMAAPVVSAMAAILRSEYTDRDKYPTKFIYGQLCSTSEHTATCLDPEAHGLHNLPQIVDLNAALTKMPTPEVNMQEYYLFDTNGLYENNGNNGDGVIDAGETIALGLTLRNRWGMSEDTVVTIDTLSMAGIADPYITIHNPEVNYGSVGTYSTQDAGKLFTDELFTAWENPFYITIAEDCPNDYIFKLNVTVSCGNALDEEDNTTYITTSEICLTVRNGVILPQFIEEDMTLTKDNLYIIPTATIINQGVTVRVEPGTHIQFWSDDASDPYADSYIAYLVVNGNFVVEGTKEEPVYIYPSELMDRYGVEIGATSTGYVSLTYADVTNFFYGENHTGTGNRVNYAEHCTFRNNYGDYYKYRYISNGVVHENCWTRWGCIGTFETAKDCVFYKLGFGEQVLYGNFDRCMFAQCGIVYQMNYYWEESSSYNNCVFLGNSMVDQTNPDIVMNSSLYAPLESTEINEYAITVHYWPETGTTYVAVQQEYVDLCQNVLQKLYNAEYTVIETEEELNWLANNLNFEYMHDDGHMNRTYDLGIVYDRADGCYTWHDGSALPEFLSMSYVPDGYSGNVYLSNNYLHYLSDEWNRHVLFEIPGYVLPTQITFKEYAIALDLEATYQLNPINLPTQLPLDGFIYESSDETVVTVSDTGLITPVAIGSADVYVYSQDRAVYNYVSVEVKEYVALESLTFPYEFARVAAGESLAAGCDFLPSNTTRKNAVYTSSDETVALVDSAGNITGVSAGTATITATCEDMTVEMTVEVYIKANTLTLDAFAMNLVLGQGTVELPNVSSNAGADLDLVWRSTDEDVAIVEDGKLTLVGLGSTTLVVKDQASGLSASCLVVVREEAAIGVNKLFARNSNHYALMEDGMLYYWTSDGTPYVVTTGVLDFSLNGYYSCIAVLKEDAVVECYYVHDDGAYSYTTITEFAGKELIGIAFGGGEGNYALFGYTADGYAYAMGTAHSSGCLGVATTNEVTSPKLVPLDGIVDIVTDGTDSTYFLTADGNLYCAGGGNTTQTPMLIATDVANMFHNTVYGSYIYCLGTDGIVYYINSTGTSKSQCSSDALSSWGNISYQTESCIAGLQDGVIYYVDSYNSWNKIYTVPAITNAEQIYVVENTIYILTEDNGFFAYTIRENYYDHIPGASVVGELIPVCLQLVDGDVTNTGMNLEQENVLREDRLVLEFNKSLLAAYAELYADGNQIVVRCSITEANKLEVYLAAGFKEGVSYEMVIPAEQLTGRTGETNSQEIRVSFTYEKAEKDEDIIHSEQEEVVIHDSVMNEELRVLPNTADTVAEIQEYITEHSYNYRFHGNAILNPVSTDYEVSHWLRLLAPEVQAGSYAEILVGENYWGTVNERAIGLQMIDYADFPNYARFNYAPYLTEAPENTFPFVTGVTLINKNGEEVTIVGNEEITFRVTFNRDMDTSIPLQVRFGSAYPYGDYEISGEYVDARTWEGTYTLNTLIENGNQYFSISNGCSATDDLELQWDLCRFTFEIDTTAAQALLLQGTATDTGINLTWTQDDFDTLMGYNVYRSTAEDGYYTRLNSAVISADQMEFFDDTVEPGVVYYYNFTVVQTDLTESEPSGKISIMSKDTMAPDIYHSPVANAFTGSNLVISATVTDNLNIAYANLYYRIVGEEEWRTIRMNVLNSKYSAIIAAEFVTLDGIEYYIEAFDGVSYTYKGSAENPYLIAVQEAVDENSLGDVNGDGSITNLDALLVLYAINDKANLSAEEFARADLNGDGELWAAEALRILQYVNGLVGSVVMQ